MLKFVNASDSNHSLEILRNEEDYKSLEISFDVETRKDNPFLDCEQAPAILVPATTSALVPPSLNLPPLTPKRVNALFLTVLMLPKTLLRKPNWLFSMQISSEQNKSH